MGLDGWLGRGDLRWGGVGGVWTGEEPEKCSLGKVGEVEECKH